MARINHINPRNYREHFLLIKTIKSKKIGSEITVNYATLVLYGSIINKIYDSADIGFRDDTTLLSVKILKPNWTVSTDDLIYRNGLVYQVDSVDVDQFNLQELKLTARFIYLIDDNLELKKVINLNNTDTELENKLQAKYVSSWTFKAFQNKISEKLIQSQNAIDADVNNLNKTLTAFQSQTTTKISEITNLLNKKQTILPNTTTFQLIKKNAEGISYADFPIVINETERALWNTVSQKLDISEFVSFQAAMLNSDVTKVPVSVFENYKSSWETNLVNIQTDLSAKIKNNTSTITDLSTKINISANTANLTAIKVNTNTNLLETLTTNVNNNNTKITELTNQTTICQTELKELTNNVVNNTNNLNTAITKIGINESKINDLTTKNYVNTTNLVDLTTKTSSNISQIATLSTQQAINSANIENKMDLVVQLGTKQETYQDADDLEEYNENYLYEMWNAPDITTLAIVNHTLFSDNLVYSVEFNHFNTREKVLFMLQYLKIQSDAIKRQWANKIADLFDIVRGTKDYKTFWKVILWNITTDVDASEQNPMIGGVGPTDDERKVFMNNSWKFQNKEAIATGFLYYLKSYNFTKTPNNIFFLSETRTQVLTRPKTKTRVIKILQNNLDLLNLLKTEVAELKAKINERR